MNDYINRRELMKALYDMDGVTFEALDAVGQFPSTQGEWVEVEIDHNKRVDVASMRCSRCQRWYNRVFFFGNPTDFANFCPFCGAEMGMTGGASLDGIDCR